MGPVQVLVVGFDEPNFSGAAVSEFTRLEDAGIVRLVDLLLVSRAEDGTFETMDGPVKVSEHQGELVAALLGNGAGADNGTADESTHADGAGWSLADAVPRGTIAAVALIEHVWAEPLRTAIQGAGGRPLEETWLSPADVELLASYESRLS
jgi:hypothetical protein